MHTVLSAIGVAMFLAGLYAWIEIGLYLLG